jgi:hypothetical protein
VGLGRRSDRACPRFKEIAGDQQLVRVEQALDALIFMVEGRPDLAELVRIAKQLVDCRTDGALDPRTLEFRNDDGNAVDEAHCVGNDVAPATG